MSPIVHLLSSGIFSIHCFWVCTFSLGRIQTAVLLMKLLIPMSRVSLSKSHTFEETLFSLSLLPLKLITPSIVLLEQPNTWLIIVFKISVPLEGIWIQVHLDEYIDAQACVNWENRGVMSYLYRHFLLFCSSAWFQPLCNFPTQPWIIPLEYVKCSDHCVQWPDPLACGHVVRSWASSVAWGTNKGPYFSITV